MVIKTTEINKKLKNPAEFILLSEKRIDLLVENCAEKILPSLNEKPIILISGPSGSCKTTVAIKLAKAFRKSGVAVCYLSMDKYLKNFTAEQKELKRLGKIDLEAPERVDSKYLNRDIKTLLDGGEINLPVYSFLEDARFLTETTLQRNGGFVIVEGIHALNSDIMAQSEPFANKIYVSVRTRVSDCDGNRLHPCKIRLLRRILRDNLYRGRTTEDTVKMFSKVQHGENKFILPYKHFADYSIDTFIEYEPCIYRQYLFESLVALSPKYSDLKDVVNALGEINPMASDNIPPDAFMREFIGGSSLAY